MPLAAFLADAVTFARHQRRHYPVCEHDRAHLIGDTAVQINRLVGVNTRDINDPRSCLREIIERRMACVGAVRYVARRTRVDNPRIARAHLLVAESEPACHALAEVLDEDVALLGQSVDDLARFSLAQVERDTLLVAIVGLEVEIVTGGRGCGGAADRKDVTARVALLPLLDLDYFGAQVGQHRRRPRALLPYRPVDDPDTFKRCVHVAPILQMHPIGLAPLLRLWKTRLLPSAHLRLPA